MTMTDDIMTDDIMTDDIMTDDNSHNLNVKLPCTRHVTLLAAQMSGKIQNSNNIPTHNHNHNIVA
ncbi:unnamed protein product [Callosobruchus maculatus]|uniref:Uncharacterized protein n=1 Tax=Callosobruchus maculatus TaxID=64391 RepID=A0A653D9M2_CALMS|nr:unnamed protein product [Callosobruchus maculatus]